MEDIWNITALVVSVLSVLLSLYALRQATTKNTSDMYLFFISQYAKEDMKLALRKLKDIKNETPTDFIRKMRLKQAEHLLKTTNETVLEVMYKCGFNNKAYFYRLFLREYNMTPKEYRESVKK